MGTWTRSGNWLKSDEINTGDVVKLVDGGAWEDSQYKKDDGTPRRQYVIRVIFKGEEKKMRLTQASGDNLADAFGEETEGWAGKKATIEKVKVMVGGKVKDSLLLIPIADVTSKPEEVDLDVDPQEPEDESPF